MYRLIEVIEMASGIDSDAVRKNWTWQGPPITEDRASRRDFVQGASAGGLFLRSVAAAALLSRMSGGGRRRRQR